MCVWADLEHLGFVHDRCGCCCCISDIIICGGGGGGGGVGGAACGSCSGCLGSYGRRVAPAVVLLVLPIALSSPSPRVVVNASRFSSLIPFAAISAIAFMFACAMSPCPLSMLMQASMIASTKGMHLPFPFPLFSSSITFFSPHTKRVTTDMCG